MLDSLWQIKTKGIRDSVNHLINVLCKQQLCLDLGTKNSKRRFRKIFSWLTSQANKRKFPRRRLISNGIDQIWAADLVEIQKFSKWNKGSSYGNWYFFQLQMNWIVPLKNKKGDYVSKALKQLLKERIPKFLWTDKGKDFFNKNVDEILK